MPFIPIDTGPLDESDRAILDQWLMLVDLFVTKALEDEPKPNERQFVAALKYAWTEAGQANPRLAAAGQLLITQIAERARAQIRAEQIASRN